MAAPLEDAKDWWKSLRVSTNLMLPKTQAINSILTASFKGWGVKLHWKMLEESCFSDCSLFQVEHAKCQCFCLSCPQPSRKKSSFIWCQHEECCKNCLLVTSKGAAGKKRHLPANVWVSSDLDREIRPVSVICLFTQGKRRILQTVSGPANSWLFFKWDCLCA